jgi:hypothetical protein
MLRRGEEDIFMLNVAQAKEDRSPDSEDEEEQKDDSTSRPRNEPVNGTPPTTSLAAPGEEASPQEVPYFRERLRARAPNQIIVEPSTAAPNLTTIYSLTIPTISTTLPLSSKTCFSRNTSL